MDEKDFAIFTHEYIHFLQAITTIYGLNQIHITVEYFRDANNVIYRQPNPGTFSVPIEPDISRENNVYYNWRIFELTQGDHIDYHPATLTKAPEIIEEQINSKCPVQSIHSVILHFKGSSGQDEMYSFGAVCIMESMAYMLEKYLSPTGFAQSPNLPYNSAMLVGKNG